MSVETYVGLIGDQGSGKTALMTALYTKFSEGGQFSALSRREEVRRFMDDNNLEHSATFRVVSVHAADRHLMSARKEGLRTIPIIWPATTTFGDFYPIVFEFLSRRVFRSEQSKQRERNTNSMLPEQSSLLRTLTFADFPGFHFDPDWESYVLPAQVERTHRLLRRCGSLIVCIDCSAIDTTTSNKTERNNSALARLKKVMNRLVNVIKSVESHSKESNPDRIVPVCLAFTKFDLLVKEHGREIAEARVANLFETIGVGLLSSTMSGMWVLGCPISLARHQDEEEILSPDNVETPFLFSVMGEMLARSWYNNRDAKRATADAERIREMSFWKWLWSDETNSKIHDTKAERGRTASAGEWDMARNIYEALCIEQFKNPKRVMSARGGQEVELVDMLFEGKSF